MPHLVFLHGFFQHTHNVCVLNAPRLKLLRPGEQDALDVVTERLA